MVDVSAVPHLVVVGRAARCLEQCAMIGQDAFADTTLRFVDGLEQDIDGEVVETQMRFSHGRVLSVEVRL